MIYTRYCGKSSACLELEGTTPYYAKDSYTVLVNGESCFRRDTNVFSLFGLKPAAEYTVTIRFDGGGEEVVTLTTEAEPCCVSVKDFGAVGDGVHEDTPAILSDPAPIAEEPYYPGPG